VRDVGRPYRLPEPLLELDSLVVTPVELLRARFFDFFAGSAGAVVTLPWDPPALTLSPVAVLSVAVSEAPLPPTAVPAGGWNDPRNCWTDPGIWPFGYVPASV